MERLDKIIATALQISRKDAIALIKRGRIAVNKETIKDPKAKFDENGAVLFCDNEQIYYNKYVYIMMNKPKGVISASNGKGEKTVVDILPPDMKRKNLFPAGRLDKDTTGVVILTNDGAAAHNALSPKQHVTKKYYLLTADEYSDDDILAIENGLTLKDGYTTKPCKIDRISDKEGYIYLTEGKYHEIKRLFGARGNKIVGLERKAFGTITADDLECGKWRYMTSEEISAFKNE